MNLKHVLIGAVVFALCTLGGLWLFLRFEQPNASLDAFQQACTGGQRQGITGGASTLPLDDETEAKLLAYCDCAAREVATRLSSRELADIGLGQSSAEVHAKLSAIFEQCRAANP